MTLLGLVQAAVRRWPLLLLGAVVTALALIRIITVPGLYYVQADVVFLRPVEATVPNSLSVTTSSLTATAGLVQREVSGGVTGSQVVSQDVTLVGEGVRAGARVHLPNSGGQWANNFDRAVLDVQAVDASEVATRARYDALVGEVRRVLERRQREAHIDRDLWITVQTSPQDPPVVYLAPHRRPAMVLTLALGGGATSAAVVLAEARQRRREAAARIGPTAGQHTARALP